MSSLSINSRLNPQIGYQSLDEIKVNAANPNENAVGAVFVVENEESTRLDRRWTTKQIVALTLSEVGALSIIVTSAYKSKSNVGEGTWA